MNQAFCQGWLSGVTHVPSPNFADRDPECAVTLLVVHAISLPPREFGSDDVFALFTNSLHPDQHPYLSGLSSLRVSAHFFIRRDGALVQFVSCDKIAWHAGVSTWRGVAGCNAYSIGVELEGCDELPFTDEQYDALNTLTIELSHTYRSIADIVGHSEIAPHRKTDPGPCFEWSRITSPLLTQQRGHSMG